VHVSKLHYLPLTLPFFSLLVGAFLVLAILVQIRILRYAYLRLGVSPGVAILLLFGSLCGSYINIPIAYLPEEKLVRVGEISQYYVVPVIVDWPGTVIAINVGGAVIPILLSIYLLARHRLWFAGLVTTACVAYVCYRLATPVPGFGISIPIFAPPIAAAIISCVVFWRYAAPLAYVSGSLGTLIGADLMNLSKVRGLGSPIASIGGAGTFDGIFLAGIIAVLLASLVGGKHAERRRWPG
jgi:uncharacterized membrane protein